MIAERRFTYKLSELISTINLGSRNGKCTACFAC